MAYYTVNSGHVSVPSTQYASQGAYFTQPTINTYPQAYPVVHHRPAPAPGKYVAWFSITSALWLGSLLVFCGALAMAGAMVALYYNATNSEIGAGIWCGAMFVAAGAVAIAAGSHITDCLISATTATSAFAVICGVALVTISAIGLASDVNYFNCNQWCYNPYYYSCPCVYENWVTYAIVGNSLMVGAGSLAIIFAFWLFIVGCVALCRTSTQVVPIVVQPMPVQYVPAATQPTATTVNPNQQVLSVPVQYVQIPMAPNHLQPERRDDHHHGDHHD